jgi:hypothetical protein
MTKNRRMIEKIWRSAEAGEISANEARRHIFEVTGGAKDPEWASRPNQAADGNVPNADDASDLSQRGGRGDGSRAAGGLGSGARGRAGVRGAAGELRGDEGFLAPLDTLDMIARPIARGLRAIERGMATPDDPRLYAETLNRAGLPEKVDPNRPLYDQLGDQRVAAEELARRGGSEGGQEAGKKAVKYIGRVRQKASEEVGERAQRAAQIAERTEANRALKAAQTELDTFYGEGGSQATFKSETSRRFEERRLVRRLNDAKENANSAFRDRYNAFDDEKPAYLPARLRDTVDTRGADILEQEMLRFDEPDGYTTRHLMQEGSRVGPLMQMPTLSAPRRRVRGMPPADSDASFADALLDPTQAQSAADGARANPEGIPLRMRSARVLAGTGVIGTFAGGTLASHAAVNKINESNQRARDRQIDTTDKAWDKLTRNMDTRTPPEDIWRMQAAFVAMGMKDADGDPYTMDQVDGKIGRDTRAMIKRYQNAKGLPPTGYLTEDTIEKLLTEADGMGISAWGKEAALQ